MWEYLYFFKNLGCLGLKAPNAQLIHCQVIHKRSLKSNYQNWTSTHSLKPG